MQAMKLEKMLKKHMKADFMDKVKVRPDYGGNQKGAHFTTVKESDEQANELKSDSDLQSGSEEEKADEGVTG